VKVIEKNSSGVVLSDRRIVWAGGNQPAEERDASNVVITRFFAEGEEAPAATAPANKLFYTKDHLSSIHEVTDSTGALRVSYNYDLFGNRTKLSGDLNTVVGYTGHHHHAASNLILTMYRAYDAELGRWLSRDPIEEEGGINLYGYVSNNPMNLSDPLGLWGIGWGDGNGNVSGNIGWGAPTLFFTPESGMEISMAAAATLDGINPFGDPLADIGAYDPCDSDFQFSQGAGAFSRDVYTGRLLLGGLARLGGTRLGNQLLNSNRYLRIGAGRMPGNGRFPASPKAPRISIGRGPGNPHIDLRP